MDNNQQKIWLKAAVIGSIWASFEIVFGSFFHSLHLPFAGTFLTFFSMVLLIGFSYKWNDKNLFLKAGLIAALMRSIMPTSVILGPLIGILIEAVLFQTTLKLFGKNLISFSIAGILAMFSAILHKIVSIILIYGFDIVKILENLYFVLLKSTHINLPLNQLLILVIVLYTIAGIILSFTGVYIGKNIHKISSTHIHIEKKWKVNNSIFDIQHFKYKSGYIFLHLSMLFVLLLGLELIEIQWIITPIFLYLIFLIKRYGKSLRRLSKPLFWVQLIVIVLLAIWLWNNKIEGLFIGIKMILRAVLVVSVFTSISVELKNPLVKALLYKRGYSHMYATLGLATSAVPFILKNLSVEKKIFINPFKVLTKAIGLSELLLNEFTSYLEQKNKIFIISGDTRSGKTTFLKKIISTIQKEKLQYKIGGIIAHGIDKDNERFGFNIENVFTHKTAFLCSRDIVESAEKIGRFYFSKQGLTFGHQALNTDKTKPDLLVIDEIGYMELKGKGWFDDIEKALQNKDLDMIWVVRKRILEDVLKLWQHTNIQVIDIKNSQIEKVVNQILK